MSDDNGSENHASFLMRACEHCRQRKIKCDRKVPCASCRSLHIECKPYLRPAAPRTRNVANSPIQSERQISIINQRLASIEDSLKKLAGSSAHSTPRSIEAPSSGSIEDPPSNVPTYDGVSSFEAQTIQAGEAANRTAAQFLGNSSNKQLRNVLATLINSLEAHNLESRSHEAFLSSSDAVASPGDPLSLPPVDLVTAVVRRFKTHPPSYLYSSFFWRSIEQLEQLCQKCYFPANTLPSGSRTLLYGLLFFSLRDYLHDPSLPFTEQEIMASYRLCEQNFYRSIETYQTLTIPTFENVESLWFAACRAQEESKLNLVWTYCSAAATMCHAMGLHRKSTLDQDPHDIQQLKRQLFWNLYAMEKNICLSLGRRSNFRDDEIDQDHFEISDDPRQQPWDQFFFVVTQHARLQGQTYDELYSLRASMRSPEQRQAAAACLGQKVIQFTEAGIRTVQFSKAWYAPKIANMIAASDAMSYTLLTTIHRAQTNPNSGTEISAECFTYAKLALEAHVRFQNDFWTDNPRDQLEFVTWFVLFQSFLPFMVHFTRTISTVDPSDLALLARSVEMLDRLKHVNKGSQRLYNVCKAFLETAQVLVQSQQSIRGVQNYDDGSLMFTQSMDPQTAPMVSNADWAAWSEAFPNMGRNADMSMFLGNWLGDGRPVLDMLDLDGFEQGVDNNVSQP